MEKCTIQEKCRLGSLFDKKCGGGCIAHIDMTVHETITNPNYEECGLDDDTDDAEPMTGEIEVKTEHSFADIAFGMAAIGLVVAAIGVAVTTITTAFKNNKE